MRRREFITLLGGAAAWPLAGRAQQADRPKRIGWPAGIAEQDLEAQHRNAVPVQALRDLGWIVGRNLRIDYRWDAQAFDVQAAELTGVIKLN
jgi:putative ABC transport system substrate-binding protein